MNSTPRVPGDIPPMAIVHKYKYRKVLGFIATKGSGSTEPSGPYLSLFPDNYYNVSICPVFCPHVLGSYSDACNTIYNRNRMRHYGLSLDKHLVTQSGYLRLTTTVTLDMVVTDTKLIL